MTKQDTFDAVVRGLASQRWRQSTTLVAHEEANAEYTACWGLDGRKSPAGWLLPRERGLQFLRPLGVLETRTRLAEVLEEVGHDVSLVHQLEMAHDLATSPEELRAAVLAIGLEHELSLMAVP